jgi:alpha/beta superfamily hydrolase
MSEFPIWVPHDGGHLAAVVSVPAAPPRGLVLMLPGVSLYEAIGSFPLYPRAAAELSDRGLATVRLDYAGIGDSTADSPTWSISVIEPAIGQALAVLDAAQRAVGTERFAIAASCFGTRVALRLTKQLDCVGAVCLSAPVIDQGGWTRLRTRIGERRVLSFIRSNPLLRRVILRPLRRAFAEKKPTSLVSEALGQLDHARILFLYSEQEDEQSYYRQEARRRLAAISGKLSDPHRERYRVQVLPTGRLTGFDLLPAAEQALILETVVDWIDDSFAGGDGEGSLRAVLDADPAERIPT